MSKCRMLSEKCLCIQCGIQGTEQYVSKLAVENSNGTQQPLNAIALLEEWVVLENQREGCKPEYSRDLSKRTYAVLAQQQ